MIGPRLKPRLVGLPVLLLSLYISDGAYAVTQHSSPAAAASAAGQVEREAVTVITTREIMALFVAEYGNVSLIGTTHHKNNMFLLANTRPPDNTALNISSGHAALVLPPAPVPQTGQTTCHNAIGQPEECAGTGWDGDTLTGIVWPDPRFMANDDKTVTDRLTGLIWTKNADPAGGHKTWPQALAYIRALNNRNYLGYDDWRLPNINELESLVNKQVHQVNWLTAQGFLNLKEDYYWTSTTYASYTPYAWSVSMHGGIVSGRDKTGACYVWPVRTGPVGALTLPETGQDACYDDSGAAIGCAGTGQDGEWQAGLAWPRPRFISNKDETITDRLTGLLWSREGQAPGPPACGAGTHMNQQQALNYIKCLNSHQFLGWADWRLPNRNELASLIHRGQPDSAAWLSSSGFNEVQAGSYWSSSTYSYVTWNAWSVNMHDGAVSTMAKKHNIRVWPVRNIKLLKKSLP